jgi:hypothetical protein
VVPLEVIQQGFVINSNRIDGIPVGIIYSIESPSGLRMSNGIWSVTPFHGYMFASNVGVKTLQPNTEYKIVLESNTQNGRTGVRQVITFTTGAGNAEHARDDGVTSGTGGIGSGSVGSGGGSGTGGGIVRAQSNLVEASTAPLGGEALYESSSVESSSPQLRASMLLAQGSLYSMSGDTGGGQAGDSLTGASQALEMSITGLPLLWVVLVIIFIISLPLGLAWRVCSCMPLRLERGRLMPDGQHRTPASYST